MKKIFLMFICLAVCLNFSGCMESGDKYNVYFASQDGKNFVKERIAIEESTSLENRASLIVERLLQGPAKPEHKRIIPENTGLIGLRLEGKTATVNLTQDFEKTSDYSTRLLAIYSVVNTLCELDGISLVHILINGRAMNYTASENEIGPLSMNRVILADEIGKNQTVVLELYFANEEKTGLISEKRLVDVKDNETVEKTAITELAKGPEVKGHKLLSSDVKLLSVEIKDNYCYVNFSKEFLSVSASDAKLCVYSVVNTLTGIPAISSVQILVEGEKAEKLGDTILTEPFTYNAAVVD